MDAQRALLDELMGRNRDGDKPNDEIKDYRDRRVCKYFLCGLCPHELFQNTKMDLGECPKLHIPNLRTKYEKDPNKSSGYEYELERELLRFISDLDKKIYRAQKRLEEQEGFKAPSLMDVENCKEVLEITAEIQEVMLKAEEAGNEGQVDLSMELMEKVEDLKQKKADAQANAMLQSVQGVGARPPDYRKVGLEMKAPGLSELLPRNPLASTDVNQKLRVCDVCGAFLSIFDSDRRLANHFGGKLHLGYLQIRKKVEEIAEMRQEQRRKSAIPPPTEAVEKKENTAMESPNQEVKEAPKVKPEDRNSRSISKRRPDERSGRSHDHGRDRFKNSDRNERDRNQRDRNQRDRDWNRERDQDRRDSKRDRDRNRHRDRHHSRRRHRRSRSHTGSRSESRSRSPSRHL